MNCENFETDGPPTFVPLNVSPVPFGRFADKIGRCVLGHTVFGYCSIYDFKNRLIKILFVSVYKTMKDLRTFNLVLPRFIASRWSTEAVLTLVTIS